MMPSPKLHYEHDVLRGRLALIDEWVAYLPGARYTLAHIIQAVAARFDDHAEREEALLFGLHLGAQRLPAFVTELPDAHREYRARMASLLTQLLARDEPLDERAAVLARDLASDLQEHLVQEETHLFPLLDRYVREMPRRLFTRISTRQGRYGRAIGGLSADTSIWRAVIA